MCAGFAGTRMTRIKRIFTDFLRCNFGYYREFNPLKSVASVLSVFLLGFIFTINHYRHRSIIDQTHFHVSSKNT